MSSSQYPIISNPNFIVATRDAGYRNLATAIAELLDNGVQASATCLQIFVDREESGWPRIAVLDNGIGMDPGALRRALQFGGTSRFNDRSGQGRFGMGLPNSSMSQARRVEVYTWQNQQRVSFSYLDLDEVVRGALDGIPGPESCPLPSWAIRSAGGSGTLVVWRECDRVAKVENAVLLEHLHANLGRMYRHHLWDGVRILINEQQVAATDPLLCDHRAIYGGAAEFVAPLVYTMKVPRDPQRTAKITVRFSELPVSKWRDLSSAEKRVRAITRNAGVSVVRGKREVAHGWFFMGTKRRENYDDWWRCEVLFDPELDEYFGVTNTKQQIAPVHELEATLAKDIEPIARLLNSRVRSTFNCLRTDGRAARVAIARDRLLPPATTLPSRSRFHATGRRPVQSPGLQYKIEEVPSSDDSFYSVRLTGQKLVVVLNKNHPFYTHVFRKPAKDRNNERYHLECLLFALARAEAEVNNKREIEYCRRRRVRWSNVLATFLGN